MTRRMHYFGHSMNPVLRLGDGLLVVPFGERPVRVGDVVVFRHPDKPGERVVHRVVAVEPAGVRTRGDNCPQPDPWLLAPGDLMGYVAEARRDGRTFRVDQGCEGKIFTFQMLRRLDDLLSRLLRPLYRRLAASSPLRGRLTLRVLSFERPGGREWHLLLGRWVIGRRLPQGEGWEIRRPFRLLVDEADLPGEEERP